MSDTTQTDSSLPTGQDGAAGDPPASSGEDKGATQASEGSVLGGDTKTGGDQGQSGEENKTTPTSSDVEIEVKLPEGITADKEMMDGYVAAAKKAGLTSETASELAAWYFGQQQTAEEANVKAWEKQGETWKEEVTAHKEFGGEKLSATVANAQKAILKYGGDGALQGIGARTAGDRLLGSARSGGSFPRQRNRVDRSGRCRLLLQGRRQCLRARLRLSDAELSHRPVSPMGGMGKRTLACTDRANPRPTFCGAACPCFSQTRCLHGQGSLVGVVLE